MSHRSIDLLPVETRQRAEAGQRVRRTIGLCLAIAALAGTAATWSRLRAEAAEGARVQLEAMAQQAIELETQAAACGKAADDIERLMEDYRAVALPMPVSTLVAGLAEALPPGGTLESLTLQYDDGKRLGASESLGRRLLGSIEGFAATDSDVALIAKRLSGRAPFEEVRLESSGSRTVRGRPARGFTIHFQVDFARRFTVHRPDEVRDDSAMALGLEEQP